MLYNFVCPFQVDVLHTLDLGVTARLNGEYIVRFLRATRGTTMSKMKAGLIAFNRGVRQWCRVEFQRLRARGSVKQLTRIGRITIKMLGMKTASSQPVLFASAAANRTLFAYVSRQAHLHARELEAAGHYGLALARAMKAVVRLHSVMEASGREVREAGQAALSSGLLETMRHAKQAHVHMTPKWHLLRHIDAQACKAGNPAAHAVFEDESHLRDVKRCALSCSPLRVAAVGQHAPDELPKGPQSSVPSFPRVYASESCLGARRCLGHTYDFTARTLSKLAIMESWTT